MLEDAQAAGAERHEAEPLPVEVSILFEVSRCAGGDLDAHDDNIDEIDGRSLRESCIVVLLRHIVGHRAILEPESAERKSGSLEVPVGHDERCEGLEHPDEPVRLQHQAPIDQAIRFGVARLAEQDVSFGLFVGQNGGSGAVGEAADEGVLAGARHTFGRDGQKFTR